MPSRASSSGKRSGLRFLDLSFEGKDIAFKNGDMDNGRLPHGGYRGSKKQPLGIYSFDKGRDYQRQLRDDLDRLLDNDVLEVHGSPTWALEAHRQTTHSGESPLLSNKYMAASRLENYNQSNKLNKEVMKPGRCSAPPANNGVLYYRPNRMHQYLSATELKDASDCEDVLRYGRPTRTTLLRARHRVGSPSANAYAMRRQSEQRMEEIRNSCMFSNPKEFAQLQTEGDGMSTHSFLTGARYNSAHCLDSKSLHQYGVYMPRNNPLGCFTVGNRGELLDTTSAPPDSPRSDIEEGSSPVPQRRRPTTAPGYGYGRKALVPVPSPRTPRQAWGDASTALHVTNGNKGDNDGPVLEEIRVWSRKLNVKGSRLPRTLGREAQLKFESRLPTVRGTSLSKLRKVRGIDDQSEVDMPPPSPTSARIETSLPAVTSEPEARLGKPEVDRKLETDQSKAEDSNHLPITASPGEPTPGGTVAEEGVAEEEKEGDKDEEGRTEEGTGEKEGVDSEKEAAEETAASATAIDGSNDDVTNAADDAQESKEEGTVETEKTEGGTDQDEAAESPKADTATTPNQPQSEENTGVNRDSENLATYSAETAGQDDDVTTAVASAPAGNDDNVKFFLTEDGPVGAKPEGADDASGGRGDGGDDGGDDGGVDDDVTKAEGKPDDDQVSTASSKRSKGKMSVTFSEGNLGPGGDEGVKVIGDDDNDAEQTTANSAYEDRLNGVGGKPAKGHPRGHRVEDSDVDDLEQGQGQAEEEGDEPLKVIVTHIERSMGAPAPKLDEDH